MTRLENKIKKLKDFWKKRNYWQKGVIIGLIYGLLKSSYTIFFTFSTTPERSFSALVLIPLTYILLSLIGNGLFFGFVGFLLGLFLEKKGLDLKKYKLIGGLIGFIVGSLFQTLIYIDYYFFDSYRFIDFISLFVFFPLGIFFITPTIEKFEFFSFIAFVGWFTILGIIFSWFYWMIYNKYFKDKFKKTLTILGLSILVIILMLIILIFINLIFILISAFFGG